MKKILVFLCVGTILCGTLAGCAKKANDEYADTLKSGVEKYDNGEAMTQDEYKAVKNMKEWKDKEDAKTSEKTYSQWESQN